MRQSMVRVLHPDFKPRDRQGNRITPTLADYIEVPRLSTYGTYEVVQMLPMEKLARLAILRNSLAGVKTHA